MKHEYEDASLAEMLFLLIGMWLCFPIGMAGGFFLCRLLGLPT